MDDHVQGHGREEHAQPVPEEHGRPHRGDQEPEPVPQPVSVCVCVCVCVGV